MKIDQKGIKHWELKLSFLFHYLEVSSNPEFVEKALCYYNRTNGEDDPRTKTDHESGMLTPYDAVYSTAIDSIVKWHQSTPTHQKSKIFINELIKSHFDIECNYKDFINVSFLEFIKYFFDTPERVDAYMQALQSPLKKVMMIIDSNCY